MIFTSAMRWTLPTYITRLLGARRPQSLGSELTTIPTTINHPDKGVSSLLTRASPTRQPGERPAAPGGATGCSKHRALRFLPHKMLTPPEGARSLQGAQDHRGWAVGTSRLPGFFLVYLFYSVTLPVEVTANTHMMPGSSHQ